jgi:hypothetical protein
MDDDEKKMLFNEINILRELVSTPQVCLRPIIFIIANKKNGHIFLLNTYV